MKKEVSSIIQPLVWAAIFSVIGLLMWESLAPVLRLRGNPETREIAENAFLLGAFTGSFFGLAVGFFSEFLRRLVEAYRKGKEKKSHPEENAAGKDRVTLLLLVCGLATILSIVFIAEPVYWWQSLPALCGICLGVIGIFRGIDRLVKGGSRKKRAQSPQQNSVERNSDK